ERLSQSSCNLGGVFTTGFDAIHPRKARYQHVLAVVVFRERNHVRHRQPSREPAQAFGFGTQTASKFCYHGRLEKQSARMCSEAKNGRSRFSSVDGVAFGLFDERPDRRRLSHAFSSLIAGQPAMASLNTP